MFKVGDKVRIRNTEFIHSIKKQGSNTKVLKLPGNYSIRTTSIHNIAGTIGTIIEVNQDDDEGCEHRHIYWVETSNEEFALPIEILIPLNNKPVTRRPLCK